MVELATVSMANISLDQTRDPLRRGVPSRSVSLADARGPISKPAPAARWTYLLVDSEQIVTVHAKLSQLAT